MCLCYKLKGNPLAMELLTAVQVWQQRHVAGKPHAMGSAGTAVGTVLLRALQTHGSSHYSERGHAFRRPEVGQLKGV